MLNSGSIFLRPISPLEIATKIRKGATGNPPIELWLPARRLVYAVNPWNKVFPFLKHGRQGLLSKASGRVAVAISRASPYSARVNAIARELDETLQKLDPQTAASVERLVRDALALAAKQPGLAESWPAVFWISVREMLGPEPLERPSQGELEKREDW